MLAPGLVTTIGSLPHVGLDAAVGFALAGDPALPAAPQLPGRTRPDGAPAEGMLAQLAGGLAGVAVRRDGRLAVDAGRLRAALAAPGDGSGGTVPARLDPASHGGALAFLAACAAARRTGPVKLQLTGPVTLGLALADGGAPHEIAFEAARRAVRATGAALVAAARSLLPGVALTVWLDEPGLVAWPRLPVDDAFVTALLADALDGLGTEVVPGLHCCGPTDWGLASAAGAVVLSMPVAVAVAVSVSVSEGGAEGGAGDAPAALDRHLARGGWIAWGAVPTDRPVADGDEATLWAQLLGRWAALAGAGCDPDLLRRRALVTPVCGLAGLTEAQAATVVGLTRRLGHRVAREARGRVAGVPGPAGSGPRNL